MSTDIWAEIKAIWRAIDILKSFDVPDISVITGWQKDIDSWTYASSTTLTITGDVTARFPVGTKIKLTQTTVKYFYVVSAVFSSPNTTLTLTGGSDYSLANAAITLPYYSYASTPQGFPQWFSWSVSWTGLTVTGSPTYYARFTLDQKKVFFSSLIAPVAGSTVASVLGTSYINNLPITCYSGWGATIQAADNTRVSLGMGYVDPATVKAYTPAWGANGNYITINGWYHI